MKLAESTLRRFKFTAAVMAAAVIGLWICNRFVFPLPENRLHPRSATFVSSREGYLLSAFTAPDRYWRLPVKVEKISPLLVKSVIAAEDRWFYYHPGINPVSLLQAALANWKAGKIVRGGSTITMQIARMMEPKARTVTNKMREILRAFQLELNYSKRELLEIYFNMVPYGGNIEGIGAASYFYFDKAPDRLTLSESAILAAIPAAPSEFRPDRDPALCRQRRDRVLAFLNSRNMIDDNEYRNARAEEIPDLRVATPFVAPHFCQYAALLHPDRAAISSTIDFRLQSLCEKLARRHHAEIRTLQIHNLAVVVIENESAELLALVGSPLFEDADHGGQINGALARRSPGSALKPFVYALALEQGLISPEKKLEDIPINYGGYIPENYDEKYHGLVSTSEALIQSLNVPAVNLTAALGLETLDRFLRLGGITTLHRKYQEYGLPLILGSGEVSLLELSNLYATLGRRGIYRPIKTIREAKDNAEHRLLSVEASYLVSEILSDLQRPDLPSSWEFSSDRPRVAWKTGTSYGRKDAWAIGYNPKYTVGVWAGNFSGEGSADIVGAEIAAPLMHDIFNQIAGDEKASWFKMPEGVAAREICVVSGMPAGSFCRDRKYEHFIPGKSPAEECRVHKMILVDRGSGYALCRACSRGKAVEEIIIEHWPPRVAGWLKGSGQQVSLPEHNPQCRAMLAGAAPVIISPEKGAVYILRDYLPRQHQGILLDAAVAADSRQVHWFLDNVLLQTAASGERIFYLPQRGNHSLLCLDEQGRSAAISFEVK